MELHGCSSVPFRGMTWWGRYLATTATMLRPISRWTWKLSCGPYWLVIDTDAWHIGKLKYSWRGSENGDWGVPWRELLCDIWRHQESPMPRRRGLTFGGLCHSSTNDFFTLLLCCFGLGINSEKFEHVMTSLGILAATSGLEAASIAINLCKRRRPSSLSHQVQY